MEQLPYIGQLKYPITIEREIKTRTTTGGEEVSDYTVIADIKADLKKQTGKDDVEGKVRSLIDRSYIIRFKPELIQTNADNLIVRDRGQMYRVYHTIEIKRRRYIEILTTSYE